MSLLPQPVPPTFFPAVYTCQHLCGCKNKKKTYCNPRTLTGHSSNSSLHPSCTISCPAHSLLNHAPKAAAAATTSSSDSLYHTYRLSIEASHRFLIFSPILIDAINRDQLVHAQLPSEWNTILPDERPNLSFAFTLLRRLPLNREHRDLTLLQLTRNDAVISTDRSSFYSAYSTDTHPQSLISTSSTSFQHRLIQSNDLPSRQFANIEETYAATKTITVTDDSETQRIASPWLGAFIMHGTNTKFVTHFGKDAYNKLESWDKSAKNGIIGDDDGNNRDKDLYDYLYQHDSCARNVGNDEQPYPLCSANDSNITHHHHILPHFTLFHPCNFASAPAHPLNLLSLMHLFTKIPLDGTKNNGATSFLHSNYDFPGITSPSFYLKGHDWFSLHQEQLFSWFANYSHQGSMEWTFVKNKYMDKLIRMILNEWRRKEENRMEGIPYIGEHQAIDPQLRRYARVLLYAKRFHPTHALLQSYSIPYSILKQESNDLVVGDGLIFHCGYSTSREGINEAINYWPFQWLHHGLPQLVEWLKELDSLAHDLVPMEQTRKRRIHDILNGAVELEKKEEEFNFISNIPPLMPYPPSIISSSSVSHSTPLDSYRQLLCSQIYDATNGIMRDMLHLTPAIWTWCFIRSIFDEVEKAINGDTHTFPFLKYTSDIATLIPVRDNLRIAANFIASDRIRCLYQRYAKDEYFETVVLPQLQ